MGRPEPEGQRIWLHSKVTHSSTFMFTRNHSQHEKEHMLCLRPGTQPRVQIEPSIAHFLPTNWRVRSPALARSSSLHSYSRLDVWVGVNHIAALFAPEQMDGWSHLYQITGLGGRKSVGSKAIRHQNWIQVLTAISYFCE